MIATIAAPWEAARVPTAVACSRNGSIARCASMARTSSVVAQPFSASRTDSGSGNRCATVCQPGGAFRPRDLHRHGGRTNSGAQRIDPGQAAVGADLPRHAPQHARGHPPGRSPDWPSQASPNAPSDRSRNRSATATITPTTRMPSPAPIQPNAPRPGGGRGTGMSRAAPRAGRWWCR